MWSDPFYKKFSYLYRARRNIPEKNGLPTTDRGQFDEKLPTEFWEPAWGNGKRMRKLNIIYK